MANQSYGGNPRNRLDRDRNPNYRQAEQFETGYGNEDNPRFGQQGESWRSDRQQTGWEAEGYDRPDRDFRSSSSRYPGENFQDQDRETERYGAERNRSAASWGAGSRLASAHGEWHSPEPASRYETGRYGSSRSNWSAGQGRDSHRGFMARAGDEVASWFGDDDAQRRREADHRGRGPANYTRSDERIREDANDRLTDDWRVDASNITVTVASAEVTLDGTVNSREEKRRAEDLVDDLSGVKHVQNNLRVQDRAWSTTSETKKA